MTEMKYYRIRARLEFLEPFHIGSGQNEKITINKTNGVVQLADKFDEARSILSSNIKTLPKILQKKPSSPFKNLSIYDDSSINPCHNNTTPGSINLFISYKDNKGDRRLYIPGSSIKGVIKHYTEYCKKITNEYHFYVPDLYPKNIQNYALSVCREVKTRNSQYNKNILFEVATIEEIEFDIILYTSKEGCEDFKSCLENNTTESIIEDTLDRSYFNRYNTRPNIGIGCCTLWIIKKLRGERPFIPYRVDENGSKHALGLARLDPKKCEEIKCEDVINGPC